MLNLDEARFRRIQSGAVALARPIDETIGRLLSGGEQNIFSGNMTLPRISRELRALISPVLLATARERVNAHLEVVRNHPPTTRRCDNRVAC